MKILANVGPVGNSSQGARSIQEINDLSHRKGTRSLNVVARADPSFNPFL